MDATDFIPEPARFPDGGEVTPEALAERFVDGASVRQGDVLLVRRQKPCGAAPLDRENGAVVLAHGEVTGHKHQFLGPQVAYYRDSGHEYVTVVGKPEPLVHEEHSAIPQPPGDYELGQQVEYSPAELRNVAD